MKAEAREALAVASMEDVLCLPLHYSFSVICKLGQNAAFGTYRDSETLIAQNTVNVAHFT